MSRRKRNSTLPERLGGEKIRQLSWNMETNDSIQANNDCIIVPDTPGDVSMLNCRGSSPEIQQVYLLDYYYKLTICDEVYTNDSDCLLGYLHGMLDCLPAKSTITATYNILVKIHKTMGEDGAYGEPYETTTSQAKDGNLNKQFLNVVATYEQIDSLQFLCKKGILTIVANPDDLVNQSQCKIMVYLNETGFTEVSVPSEDPSMGKVYRSMQIIMQWLHGPLLADVGPQPCKHYDDQIESVFNRLKSKQHYLAKASTSTADNTLPSEAININHSDLDKLQHSALVPLLRGYQKRAVHWMIEQETVDTKAIATGKECCKYMANTV